MVYIFMVINVLLLVGGQVLWKMGVNNIGEWNMYVVFKTITSPLVIGGIILYGIATFLWLYILSKVPLSTAYPFQSLSYVIGIIVAYFLFGEIINFKQMIGIVCIIAGVILISK